MDKDKFPARRHCEDCAFWDKHVPAVAMAHAALDVQDGSFEEAFMSLDAITDAGVKAVAANHIDHHMEGLDL